MRVGFVGLGAMGLPMTLHLIDSGHDVTVASRRRGPIDAAVSAGKPVRWLMRRLRRVQLPAGGASISSSR